MRTPCFLILSFFLAATVTSTRSEDFGDAGRDIETHGLDGILLDRTITQIGHAYFKYFSDHWLGVPGVQKYSLTFYERPSPQWGSLIWIEHDGNRIYQAFLSQKLSQLQTKAESAAERIAEILPRIELEKTLLDNSDLVTDGY